MNERNQTLVTEFLLLGFGELYYLKILLFSIVLIIYVMALASNVLVVVLCVVIQSLHCPMYFFLSQLSLSEILFTSNIVPNMLWLILVGAGKVSVSRCIFQFFLLAFPTVFQCLMLASMSFDRYVAICKPLHYAIIMAFRPQVQIVTSCWLIGFMVSLVLYFLLNSLEFCGLNTINHYYCDISPVVALSCSENSSVGLVTSVLAFPVVVCPFMFISSTYISIIHTILKIPSTNGRQKAFSTCSSHLTVVGLYYGSLGSKYIFPSNSSSVNMNKGLSLLYTLVTPLVNPLIYSLRNQEIRSAIGKLIHL
ncbi:olfactory receptor 10R2-like [Hyperolius riggenbachi]|uniref:olfactory receptor 10R2-like n=1 Tax=Hyperolius riggenbachi TaxID=752182 RepID=UPI0035A283E9